MKQTTRIALFIALAAFLGLFRETRSDAFAEAQETVQTANDFGQTVQTTEGCWQLRPVFVRGFFGIWRIKYQRVWVPTSNAAPVTPNEPTPSPAPGSGVEEDENKVAPSPISEPAVEEDDENEVAPLPIPEPAVEEDDENEVAPLPIPKPVVEEDDDSESTDEKPKRSDEELRRIAVGTWAQTREMAGVSAKTTYSFNEDGTCQSVVESAAANMKVETTGTYSIKDGIMTFVPDEENLGELAQLAVEFPSEDVMQTTMILTDEMKAQLEELQKQMDAMNQTLEDSEVDLGDVNIVDELQQTDLLEEMTAPQLWDRVQ